MSATDIPSGGVNIERDAVRDDIRDCIEACEREMGWKLATLATLTQIPYSTLVDARACKITLGTEHLLRLLAIAPPHLGDLALASTNRTLGVTDPQRAEDDRLLAEMIHSAGELAEAKADGVVNHREERRMLPRWRRVRSMLDARIRKATGE